MADLFIGIMSGTSLDGADVVLAEFDETHRPRIVATASSPFDEALRGELLALQRTGADELHRAALAANRMVDFHASLVARVCERAGVEPVRVTAIGAHGQTVRHRPELGYTLQLNAPARLAEVCGIAVVADFRSRDVAAGGQGAPLVPAFHDAIYRSADRHRVVLNLGGMANVTDLPIAPAAQVRGWDCGPGNVLLDGWTARHRQETFDADGRWAAGGMASRGLLERLLSEPWFALPPPKSTGRDRFDMDWLDERLGDFASLSAVDVQATLSALTATTIVDAIVAHAGSPDELIVCGGGAYNADLLNRLASRLSNAGLSTAVLLSSQETAGGVAPEHVEALAFAWLAMRCLSKEPGNLPAVTGARGLRVLGAIHPR
ncbi:MAG: anhydro-N-acetylmuramic acid kinase [Burkholderiaceae bacterium]